MKNSMGAVQALAGAPYLQQTMIFGLLKESGSWSKLKATGSPNSDGDGRTVTCLTDTIAQPAEARIPETLEERIPAFEVPLIVSPSTVTSKSSFSFIGRRDFLGPCKPVPIGDRIQEVNGLCVGTRDP